MRKIAYIILILLICAGNALARSGWYNCTSILGGAEGSLDSINGILLNDGDKAIAVTVSGQSYLYSLDSDSALSEDSTNYSVVSPDSNAGDKRWILQFSGGRVILPDSTIDQGSSSTTGTLAWHISNAGGNNTVVTVLPGTYTVSTNTTIPATMTLQMNNGAVLAIATGVTLTINGPVDLPIAKVFTLTGTGKAEFATNYYIKEGYAEWWGAVPGDNTTRTATTAALNAACASGIKSVQLLNGTYYTNGVIDLTKDAFTLRGINRNVSVISNTGSHGITHSDSGGRNYMLLENFQIKSEDATNAYSGLNFTAALFNSTIRNVLANNWGDADFDLVGLMNVTIQDCYFSNVAGNASAYSLKIVRHGVQGSPSTLRMIGNYFAYNNANYQIYMEDMQGLVSIGDIIESSAGVGWRITHSGGNTTNNIKLIGTHFEGNTGNNLELHDVTQGLVMANAGTTVTWTDVAADQRYVLEITPSGYGTIRGLAGISDNNTYNSYDLAGTVTVSNTDTYATVTLTKAQADTNYRVVAVASTISGSAASGSWRVKRIAKSAGSFDLHVEAAPGASESVVFDWILIRG